MRQQNISTEMWWTFLDDAITNIVGKAGNILWREDRKMARFYI